MMNDDYGGLYPEALARYIAGGGLLGNVRSSGAYWKRSKSKSSKRKLKLSKKSKKNNRK